MLKQLLRNPFVHFLIGRTLGLYMLFVGVTTRWKKVNRQAIEPFFAGDKPMIGCIWHGRFALVHKLWAFGPGIPKAKMLISQSREGDITQHVARTVGAEVIRGSAPKGRKRKGGFEALRAMARHIEDGGVICMTPDGPRGPRMRASLAAVQLAKLAGAQMVGVTWSTKNRKVFTSWDRFILPLPFGRGALVWTDPIPAPSPDADSDELERIRAKLETEMIRIAAEADRLAGAEVIPPESLERLEAEPAAT
jgi:lysophospholipid acyltransferase (LPLAT)-like uncharacterized protein